MTAPDTNAIRAQMEILAGFTSGPWFSSNQPGDWGLGGAHHIHTEEANPYEWDQSICHVEYQTPYCLGEKRAVIEAADFAAANARLIAAAPTMHAAILTLCDALDAERAEVERLRVELAWYGEQSRLARIIHSEGDAGRHALQTDGGNRAHAALNDIQTNMKE